MPSHAAAIGHAAFDGVARVNGLLFRALGRNPRDTIALCVGALAAGAIVINALYMQPGPHPSPIFSIKPRPVATEPPGGVVPAVTRVKPAETPKQPPAAPAVQAPPAAAAPQAVPAPVPLPRPAPSRADPIGDLIAPPPTRVTAVQRALNDYGYGPVKATGIVGPETVAAIQKFERDRKLPVTGAISPRLVRELSALAGRPLE